METGTVNSTQTTRADWDALIDELFANVIAGTSFGIGIASHSKSFLGSTLKVRTNQRFPQVQIPSYIRKNFGSKQLERLFASDEGLERHGGGNVLKVVGDNIGLPKNTLLMRFSNPQIKHGLGVILFGGERLEGHLERKAQTASDILSGTIAPRNSPLGREDPDEYIERLAKINVKRMFEYDIELLSRLVNALEEEKENLPKNLKPVYKSVSDYILKKKGLR